MRGAASVEACQPPTPKLHIYNGPQSRRDRADSEMCSDSFPSADHHDECAKAYICVVYSELLETTQKSVAQEISRCLAKIYMRPSSEPQSLPKQRRNNSTPSHFHAATSYACTEPTPATLQTSKVLLSHRHTLTNTSAHSPTNIIGRKPWLATFHTKGEELVGHRFASFTPLSQTAFSLKPPTRSTN